MLLAWTFAYALVCCFELDSLGFWPIIFASVFFLAFIVRFGISIVAFGFDLWLWFLAGC